jgi:hypothetical protein
VVRLARFSVALAALALASCGSVEPTEVVLVITSDYAVPSELDRVIVQVFGPDGRTETLTGDLDAESGLPRTLGITNPDGPLGPFRVVAKGLRGGALIVHAGAVFDFQKDRSLEVALVLRRACGTSCLCDAPSLCSTCGEDGVCEDATIVPPPFDGVGRNLDVDAGIELP